MKNLQEAVRLQKYLAEAGVASRRKAEALIAAGRVSVNGEVVSAQGIKVVPGQDRVTLDGATVRPATQKIYLLLHKPEGVVTTLHDPQGRPTVAQFVRDIPQRVFPVGRLDYDTSGLLLLTNDGDLAQRLTHPRHQIPKTYVARLQGIPQREGLHAFQTGILVEGKITAPAQIEVLRDKRPSPVKGGCTVRITLHEGRNRQVRKMCEAIGCPVVSLKRVSIGPVKLGGLPRGQRRPLTAAELCALQSSCENSP